MKRRRNFDISCQILETRTSIDFAVIVQYVGIQIEQYAWHCLTYPCTHMVHREPWVLWEPFVLACEYYIVFALWNYFHTCLCSVRIHVLLSARYTVLWMFAFASETGQCLYHSVASIEFVFIAHDLSHWKSPDPYTHAKYILRDGINMCACSSELRQHRHFSLIVCE